MEGSFTTTRSRASRLKPICQAPKTPAEMLVAVAGALAGGEDGALGEVHADAYAKKIVTEQFYDSLAALADLTEEDLGVLIHTPETAFSA